MLFIVLMNNCTIIVNILHCLLNTTDIFVGWMTQARSTLHYYVFEKVGNGEMPPLGFIYMSSNKVTTSPLPPFLIALMLKRHTVSET